MFSSSASSVSLIRISSLPTDSVTPTNKMKNTPLSRKEATCIELKTKLDNTEISCAIVKLKTRIAVPSLNGLENTRSFLALSAMAIKQNTAGMME